MVEDNILKTKFAVGYSFSMADIAIMSYLSIVVFNPFYYEFMLPIFKELKTLKNYVDEIKS